MGHLELSSHSFALRSGVRVDGNGSKEEGESGDAYAACVLPQDPSLKRKGGLAVFVEPAGEHPSLADEACRVAQSVITRQYFSDGSLSLTSSLLSALDSANRAVLEHDYEQRNGSNPGGGDSSVAVQGGGVRTKGAKVGVTAVLFRPDGSGVYLAQLAPTQAYLVHNGQVQALPEPPGWSDADEASEEESGAVPIPITHTPLPAQSLGSQPGIVVDLIYRRVEAGDMIVLVSPALARHLDRATAESIFLNLDAELISQALYEIAESHSLARAHASVIAIGVKGASGVSLDLPEEHVAPQGESVATNGGSRISPMGALGALKSRLPSLGLGTTGPKEWIGRKGNNSESEATEEDVEPLVLHMANSHDHEEHGEANLLSGHTDTSEHAETETPSTPQHPTSTLVQRPQLSLDVPPYRQPTLLFADADSADGDGEENLFDGWEDLPPALGAPKYPVLQRVAAGAENAPNRPEARPYLQAVQADAQPYTQTRVYDIKRPPAAPPAHIEFGDDDFLYDAGNGSVAGQAASMHTAQPRILRPRTGRSRGQIRVTREHFERGRAILQGGARWGTQTLRSMLPERTVPTTFMGGDTSRRLVVPRKTIIVAAVVLLMGILLFSMLSSAPASRNQQATINYLQEAKQEDLLANQPGITDTERQTHLTSALEKAQKALLADPASVEAKRLVTKVQGALDKAEGVTRLKEPKLLFDLGKITAQGAVTTTAASADSTVGITLSDMVVQSDDAYLFDKAAGRIYRCKIAAQTCSSVLASGDSAGGEKVGTLFAMTMRVNSLVALDDRFVAYVYDADTSAWQAQPLGDATNLQKPKDIATYDGNLYLLGAKPGQVTKYSSGAYGAPPTDWIQDPASMEQIKDPTALGIDGTIYVLLGDGKVVSMLRGKALKTISPTSNGAPPPTDLLTGTDLSDLYLLRADGTIIRVSKEGQTLATLKPTSSPESNALTGMAIDEGRGKVYLLRGQYVYETILPGKVALPLTDEQAQQPVVKPTVEP
ncbi:MAG TPA: hypothetical protein VJ183_12625 [Chloroflexia bacterium]|nr:hypothetical protein [Chloroflexia bacterium]